MLASAALLSVVELGDASVHMWWYVGRASGFVAYWLLFASVALGLAVSSRVFDGLLGRPWVFEVHKFLSLFVLLAMLFHGLIMLPDPYARFTLADLLVPGQSHYRNVAVGAGIVTFYGSVLLSATFYLKGVIGQKGWRLIHYATFASFVTALLHGVYAGTDSGRPLVQYMYLGTGNAVLFLTFFRILAARSAARREKKIAVVKTPEAQAA